MATSDRISNVYKEKGKLFAQKIGCSLCDDCEYPLENLDKKDLEEFRDKLQEQLDMINFYLKPNTVKFMEELK